MSDITGVIADMAHMRILISHPDEDNTVHPTTWGEFCIDNADTLEMLWECRRALTTIGVYTGGGGAAPMFTVSRVATAQAMERLAELADGWHISLSHVGADWHLTIRAKKGGDTYTYQSTDLSRLINHAWAGAPAGRV